MSLRNLMTLLGVFAVVSFGLWTATLNTGLVTFYLPGFPPREFRASLWVVGFLAILVGVLGTLLYTVVLSSKAAFSRWRRQRLDLKTAGDTELVQAGLAAAVRGEHRRALELFEEVLEHDPERLDAWVQGGNSARALGDLDKAVEMHLRARGMAPDDGDVHDALAQDFEAHGEYARAVAHLEQRLAAQPKGDAEVFARLRDLLARQARWEEALQAQEKRSKLLQDPVTRTDEAVVARGLRLEKARALLDQGGGETRQEAQSILAAILKEDPLFVPAYLLDARARMSDGDAEEAVETLEAGISATHSLELLNELVTYYFDVGDPEKAIRAFRQAADSIDGADGRAARLGLAMLYARLEMIEEAREQLEQLEDEVEFSPTVAYHLAKLSLRQGDTTGAAERFQDVIRTSDLLEPRHRCQHCGAHHGAYAMRCADCGRWGTVVLDTSDELRAVKARTVKAPRV